MTSATTRVFSGGKIPLVIGFVSAQVIGMLSGCALHSPTVNRTYVDTIPDKETYLLSKLDQRFENPAVHCELGRYYQSEGKWEKAEYHFKTALGFNPAHRESQAAYVKMLVDKGDRSAADQTVERYQRQLGTAPLEMVRLAMALAAEKMDTYAISCYEKALQLDPASFEANKQIGMFYWTRNENTKAKDYLTKSFELNPNQPLVANTLGLLGVAVEVPVFYQDYQAQTPARPQDETTQESGT